MGAFLSPQKKNVEPVAFPSFINPELITSETGVSRLLQPFSSEIGPAGPEVAAKLQLEGG